MNQLKKSTFCGTHFLNTKGNKSAGQRARKTSLELAALLKEFRAQSIAESKK